MKLKKALLISCSILIFGCNESKKWRKSVEDSVNKLTETVDQAAKAIPGERWQRIIEGVNSENDSIRKKTREYLYRVTGIKGEKEYRVSVWFEYDDNSSVEVDVFQGAYKNRNLALRRIDSRHGLEYTGRAISHPLGVDELRDSLITNMTQVFEEIVGIPRIDYQDYSKGTKINQTLKISNIPDSFLGGVHGTGFWPTQHKTKSKAIGYHISQAKQKRIKALNKFVDNLLLPINQYEFPIDPKVRKEPWNPLSGKNYVYVMMRKSDFDRVKEKNFKFHIKVHEKDNTKNTLYSSGKKTFTELEFNPDINKVVVHPYNSEDYVWYAHDMSGDTPVNIAQIKELDRLLKEIEELKKEQESEGKRWWQ